MNPTYSRLRVVISQMVDVSDTKRDPVKNRSHKLYILTVVDSHWWKKKPCDTLYKDPTMEYLRQRIDNLSLSILCRKVGKVDKETYES